MEGFRDEVFAPISLDEDDFIEVEFKVLVGIFLFDLLILFESFTFDIVFYLCQKMVIIHVLT